MSVTTSVRQTKKTGERTSERAKRTVLIDFSLDDTQTNFSLKIMATRASNRSTKAVKFLQSAESDENADSSKSMRVKIEEKKTRGRPSNTRRNRRDDDNDEEWDEANEANDDDDDEEEEDAISPEDEGSDNEQDATKKFKANRSINSVYDFG